MRSDTDVTVFLRLTEWLNEYESQGTDEIRSCMGWYNYESALLNDATITKHLSPWQRGVLWYWTRQEQLYDKFLVPFAEQAKHSGADMGYILEHYLTERKSCVPDGYEENLSQNIINQMNTFYSASMDLGLPEGWVSYVVVEPSIEDSSYIVGLICPIEDNSDKHLVFTRSPKAWNFWWSDPADMAIEIGAIAEQASHVVRLAEAKKAYLKLEGR